ncbi:LysR substrate-binding domain-containing protein, partial [Vibrio vulnificus]|uniref:LysR substrate-binding domain-containing protein n=2 Tax=Gammaproteobacteria TaxID=1236 RepID=UPI0039B52863
GETFDVVIRRGHSGWSPDVQPQPLLEDDLLLVAAPSLLHGVPLDSVHDLARHTLLSGRTRSSDWQTWAKHAGIKRLSN